MIVLNSGIGNYIQSNGIIVPFINYPVKQEKHIVRIAVSVSHTIEQIEKVIETLKKWRDKNGTD